MTKYEYAVTQDGRVASPYFGTRTEAEVERNELISADRAQGFPHTEDEYEVKSFKA